MDLKGHSLLNIIIVGIHLVVGTNEHSIINNVLWWMTQRIYYFGVMFKICIINETVFKIKTIINVDYKIIFIMFLLFPCQDWILMNKSLGY